MCPSSYQAANGQHHNTADDEASFVYSMNNFKSLPSGISLMAAIIVGFFNSTEDVLTGHGNIAKWLVYIHWRRYEAWRFLTYMCVHLRYFHLMGNLLPLVIFGIPLEMIQNTWCALLIYFAGIITGSLVSSVIDPTMNIAGASAGVYALMTAHASMVILYPKKNTKQLCAILFGCSIFALIIVNLGMELYGRFVLNENIAVVTHTAGAIAGVCVNIDTFGKLKGESWKKYYKWIPSFILVLVNAFMIVINLACPSHFSSPDFVSDLNLD